MNKKQGLVALLIVLGVVLILVGIMGAVGLGSKGAKQMSHDHHLMKLPELENRNTTVVQPANFTEQVNGVLSFSCIVAKEGAKDPIVSPGEPISAHDHVFYGATNVDENYTGSDPTKERSSCEQWVDKSSYWHPSLFNGSEKISPSLMWVSMTGNKNLTKKNLNELQLVTDKIGYRCGVSGDFSEVSPTNCSSSLQISWTFPQCWDGIGKKWEEGSHLAFSDAEGVCPDSTPESIPAVQLILDTDITGDLSKLGFSSDGHIVRHGDMIFSWEKNQLERLTACLRYKITCSVV